MARHMAQAERRKIASRGRGLELHCLRGGLAISAHSGGNLPSSLMHRDLLHGLVISRLLLRCKERLMLLCNVRDVDRLPTHNKLDREWILCLHHVIVALVHWLFAHSNSGDWSRLLGLHLKKVKNIRVSRRWQQKVRGGCCSWRRGSNRDDWGAGRCRLRGDSAAHMPGGELALHSLWRGGVGEVDLHVGLRLVGVALARCTVRLPARLACVPARRAIEQLAALLDGIHNRRRGVQQRGAEGILLCILQQLEDLAKLRIKLGQVLIGGLHSRLDCSVVADKNLAAALDAASDLAIRRVQQAGDVAVAVALVASGAFKGRVRSGIQPGFLNPVAHDGKAVANHIDHLLEVDKPVIEDRNRASSIR
eukprot:m.15213 g.15213  ORF g.15213 m.15213 type:complete len:364 (-) comp3008_c0_seq2:246-1337(-)